MWPPVSKLSTPPASIPVSSGCSTWHRASAAPAARNVFLVALDCRQDEVRTQFARPAFSRVAELNVRYLPYSELRDHRARSNASEKN